MQTTNANTRQVLRNMVYDFLYPMGQEQSAEDIEAALMGLAASYNATVKDAEGKTLGSYRTLKRDGLI